MPNYNDALRFILAGKRATNEALARLAAVAQADPDMPDAVVDELHSVHLSEVQSAECFEEQLLACGLLLPKDDNVRTK